MVATQTLDEAKKLIAKVKTEKTDFDLIPELAVSLAALIIQEAETTQTRDEKKIASQLAGMMKDKQGQVFTTEMSDQCFRSSRSSRISDQITYLIKKRGVPSFLSWEKKLGLSTFEKLGSKIPALFVPITRMLLRKEMARVILPGEKGPLRRHILQRTKENVRVNLNHLGEAILGEQEALRRLKIYLEDLKEPEINYISIKVSTIFSQLNLLSWEKTLEVLIERLSQLYQAAIDNPWINEKGEKVAKFVNLDMEEYRDLHLTVDVFKRVLESPEFHNYPAGIVLQAYIPDSFLIQQELTIWAMKRLSEGGAPIKIRIVKGANLAMEKVEASLHDWPQAPYKSKAEVDANFKRMVQYGMQPEHAQAAHLGIASHNLFDVSYALLLRALQNIEPFVCFEMLEGMADHIRRVVQKVSGDMLLYCPSAKKSELQNAIAYLIRRLDENTAEDNFLRHSFQLSPSSSAWKEQKEKFLKACKESSSAPFRARRLQNRKLPIDSPNKDLPFENEPDTDFSLPQNRKWAQEIVSTWKNKKEFIIPLIIGGKEVRTDQMVQGYDPSRPGFVPYLYSHASEAELELTLSTAEKGFESWSKTTPEKRSDILYKASELFRKKRGDFIGAMMMDGGKLVTESDPEISEGIDFIEFYRRNLLEWHALPDIKFEGKGTVLVTPPWNFPFAIPLGGVVSSLLAGNSVIFKPAPETVFIGYLIVQTLHEAGVPKDALQLFLCPDDPIGTQLIQDPRVTSVVLTGSTETAKLFKKIRPNLDLMAETGGKNSMIVSSLSDRDQAVKDLIHSAFSHGGQKCSAASLAVLEKEVYEDTDFLRQLVDAASSWKTGSAWDLETRLAPLIYPPETTLLRALTQLDPGEKWLLEPQQDPENPALWSPGIKIGVKQGSWSHQTEFFGPVLSLMCAKNLEEALEIANGNSYGLTSGIQTLDEREKEMWADKIEAGNCYINRGITGAIVRRQSFGGTKKSSFGHGSKAGGPNYLAQLMKGRQIALPPATVRLPKKIKELKALVSQILEASDLEKWDAAARSDFSYWVNHFSKRHDPSQVVGEDNFFFYKPYKRMTLRISEKTSPFFLCRSILACAIGNPDIILSFEHKPEDAINQLADFLEHMGATVYIEDFEMLVNRVKNQSTARIRFLDNLSENELDALGSASINSLTAPPFLNGRIELTNYLREISLTHAYHRYGNLGEREEEVRKPVL